MLRVQILACPEVVLLPSERGSMRDMLPERPLPPRRNSWGWICAQAASVGAFVFALRHLLLATDFAQSLASAALASGMAAAVLMAWRRG